jgi:hypothetical protein
MSETTLLGGGLFGWLNCRLIDIQERLDEQGHSVSLPVISRLLKKHNYHLRANVRESVSRRLLIRRWIRSESNFTMFAGNETTPSALNQVQILLDQYGKLHFYGLLTRGNIEHQCSCVEKMGADIPQSSQEIIDICQRCQYRIRSISQLMG